MVNLEEQLESFLKFINDNKNKPLDKEQLKKLEYLKMKVLQEGKELESQKKYVDVVLIYSQIIEILELVGKPINPNYFFNRAYSYSYLNENEKAINDYLTYIKFRKNDEMAFHNIGLIYCKKGMHEEEFKYFEEATRLNPDYYLPYRNMAVCYRDRRRYQEALEKIDKAIKIRPTKGDLYSIKGDILEALQRTEKAIENYKKAVDFDSADTYSRNQLKKLKFSDDGELTVFKIDKPSITFGDVVGLDEIKRWCKINVIMPLSKHELAKKYKRKFGGGILLYGPPGCGKTYFCSALAGEGKINFIRVKLSGIFDKWLGNTEKNIENLFKTAKKNKPCIVFIDEIDALGGKRIGGESDRYLDQAVNQILMELTELEEKSDEVLVIGATNAPWNVDDALKRSGRLGKFIYIKPPNREEIEALFKLYLSKVPVNEDINADKLARLAKNFSVTDIKSVCDEAVGNAFEIACSSETTVPVTMKMLETALKKERSDLLEWYNTVTKMISEVELKEFYPDLYEEILNIRKQKRTKIEMFR